MAAMQASGATLGRGKDSIRPEHLRLGESLAGRLASISGLAAEQLKGLTVADIAKAFPFVIDPKILFFRRVCGTVVKSDPVTGVEAPVPFATVQVEDTDCSFLGYFPAPSPWGWAFPFHCRREVIATALSDECGRFCVWIPRWDIDWVLRFRRERRCFGVIFERPSLRDLLQQLRPPEVVNWPPRPYPDPEPDPWSLRFQRGELLRQASDAFGAPVAQRLGTLAANESIGASLTELQATLAGVAPLGHLQPPLPTELKAIRNLSAASGSSGEAALREARSATLSLLARQVNLDPKLLEGLDLRHWVGPFFRCHDVLVPTWVPLIDIPDISFKVLQDTDGDGVEEVIYGESHFEVRWNAGAIPDQRIHAWPNAKAGRPCGPTEIPCGDQPAIVMVGRLPLIGDPAVFDGVLNLPLPDPSAGYAQRTNRPRVGGSFMAAPITPGRAPLRQTLSLYGCNRTDAKATHYRLLYRYSANGGASFTAPAPFTGLTWPLYRLTGGGIGEWHYPAADAQGWYLINLPAGSNAWLPQDLLLDWQTDGAGGFADGLYALTLQLGSGGAISSQSAEVPIAVDNSLPVAPFSVEVAKAAGGPFVPVGSICPVVNRGAGVNKADLFFRVKLSAAARHLRSAELTAYGCGEGDFEFVSGSGGEHPAGTTTYRHWHQDPDDNDQLLEAIYRLPASAAQGTYWFAAFVVARGFNPSGGDGGHLAIPTWAYDPSHAWINPSFGFSVFNAD